MTDGRLHAVGAIASLALILALAGCGGSPGDLMSIQVTGGPANVNQVIAIRADGQATCNKGEPGDIGSERLLDAREIERESADLAERGAIYEARGGRAALRHYVLRDDHGEITWDETARGLPPVLSMAQLLALQLGRDLC